MRFLPSILVFLFLFISISYVSSSLSSGSASVSVSVSIDREAFSPAFDRLRTAHHALESVNGDDSAEVNTVSGTQVRTNVKRARVQFLDSNRAVTEQESNAAFASLVDPNEPGATTPIRIDVYRTYLSPNPSREMIEARRQASQKPTNWNQAATTYERAAIFVASDPSGRTINLPGRWFRLANDPFFHPVFGSEVKQSADPRSVGSVSTGFRNSEAIDDYLISYADRSGQPCTENKAAYALAHEGDGTAVRISMDYLFTYLYPDPTPDISAKRARAIPADSNGKRAAAAVATKYFLPSPSDPTSGKGVFISAKVFRLMNWNPNDKLLSNWPTDASKIGQAIVPTLKSSTPSNNPSDVAESNLEWLNAARAELGQREIVGSRNNQRIVSYWSQAVISLPKNLLNDETPWCAGFVGAMLEKSGIRSTRSTMALSYRRWGTRLDGPAVGAIAVFNRGPPGRGLGHVGFVVGRTSDGFLLVLGGNQSNMVKVSEFLRDRAVTYHWPTGRALPQTGMSTLPVLGSDGQVSVNEQ